MNLWAGSSQITIILLTVQIFFLKFFCFRPNYKKVFETVKSASRVANMSGDAHQFPRLGSMTTSTISSQSSGPRMSSTLHSRRHHGGSGFPSLDSAGQSDSEGSLLTDCEDYP